MIGVILLDTCFPRLLGDIGNPKTFPFPILYERVEGALPLKVVREKDDSFLFPFIQAAKNLERLGAKAITTSCGFLAIWQKEMAAAVQVPLFTSSLIQIPWAYQLMGRRGRIGVLTADEASLTRNHLKAVGAERTPSVIRGMRPESEFHRVFVNNSADLDFLKAQREVEAESFCLVQDHPDVSAVVLECTNMAVFRREVRGTVRVPVFDILTLIHYIHSVLNGGG